MKADLLIINAKELLTIAGSKNPRTGFEMNDLGIINNGAIAVTNDTIINVGSTEELMNEYDNPLSSLSRNPYSEAGVRVNTMEEPYIEYWDNKCCETFVWKAPKYK